MKLLLEIDPPDGLDIVELHCAAAVDKDGNPVEGKWVANASFRLRKGGEPVNPLGVDLVRRFLVIDGNSMPAPGEIAEAFRRKLLDEGWEG